MIFHKDYKMHLCDPEAYLLHFKSVLQSTEVLQPLPGKAVKMLALLQYCQL